MATSGVERAAAAIAAVLAAHPRMRPLTRVAQARMPTRFGEFECIGWQHRVDGGHHLALVHGDFAWGPASGGHSATASPSVSASGTPGETDDPVLVRLHRECLAGEVLGSVSCDCHDRLDHALELIAAEGRGVCVYLRQPDGRPLSLDAHEHEPFADWELEVAAHMLADLGIRRVRLLVESPIDEAPLLRLGITPVSAARAARCR
jgi:3,4-dihydroxy 2-butanone 4-phosphate synthase/GTP cyclohydrolase II